MLQGCSDFKDLKLPDGDDLCEDLNIDDVQLNFESDDEIFGCSQGQSRYQFEDVGTNCVLMEKTISVTESDGPIENALEVHFKFQFLASFPFGYSLPVLHILFCVFVREIMVSSVFVLFISPLSVAFCLFGSIFRYLIQQT